MKPSPPHPCRLRGASPSDFLYKAALLLDLLSNPSLSTKVLWYFQKSFYEPEVLVEFKQQSSSFTTYSKEITKSEVHCGEENIFGALEKSIMFNMCLFNSSFREPTQVGQILSTQQLSSSLPSSHFLKYWGSWKIMQTPKEPINKTSPNSFHLKDRDIQSLTLEFFQFP